NLSSGLTLQRIGIRASNTALSSIWDRLLALPASFFRQFTPADLAMRVLGMDRIREPLAGPMAAGAVACVFSAFHILLPPRFAPALALPVTILAAAVGVVSVLCGWLAVRRQREVMAWESRTASKTLQFLEGVAKIRIAGAERRAFASWASSFIRA